MFRVELDMVGDVVETVVNVAARAADEIAEALSCNAQAESSPADNPATPASGEAAAAVAAAAGAAADAGGGGGGFFEPPQATPSALPKKIEMMARRRSMRSAGPFTARPPTMGLSATTLRRASASRTPSSARMGSMDT